MKASGPAQRAKTELEMREERGREHKRDRRVNESKRSTDGGREEIKR